uniref:Brd8 (inferred by orthology to a D. melanogaster protein) n=1 Tax=Anisakis simplex TaxID=6269 RepID=A0A0M3KHA0_ANISI
LRSAGGVKEVDSRREERGNAGGMVRTRASDGMPPSAHPRASASAILESDEEENEDEEENKPLGDIRSRPRREVPSSGVDAVTTPRSTRSESSRHPMGSSRRRSRRDELDETTIEQKAFMTSVWRMVSSHRHAAIFAQPVSDSIARGYSKVVKNRMDLQTLKKQVDSGRIADMLDFKRRLLLMFANAVMFNSTGHDVNNYAKEMADDSLNALRTMQKDILNMKEGAHVTRRAAAAEE